MKSKFLPHLVQRNAVGGDGAAALASALAASPPLPPAFRGGPEEDEPRAEGDVQEADGDLHEAGGDVQRGGGGVQAEGDVLEAERDVQGVPAARSGDTIPCRMTGVTLQSHVRGGLVGVDLMDNVLDEEDAALLAAALCQAAPGLFFLV